MIYFRVVHQHEHQFNPPHGAAVAEIKLRKLNFLHQKTNEKKRRKKILCSDQ